MPDPVNPFELPRIRYPDAEPLFRNGLTALSAVKEKCVVALDTNVLLVPYGTGPSTLADLRTTYSTLAAAGRLVVPGQVAREFSKWRPTKLSEIIDMIEKRRSHDPPMLADYPLLRDMQEAAEVRSLQDEYRKFVKRYQGAVGKLADRVRDWQFADPVSELYGELFLGDVVQDPIFAAKDLAEEMELRYARGIPPGYKDASKEDGGPGDLVIWKTLLSVGEQRKCPLVFVTGEEKADWWHRASGRAVLPRLELIDEYRRASEGSSFHIVSLSEFLRLFGAKASTIAEVKAEEPAVQERMTTVSATTDLPGFSARGVDIAVHEWVSAHFVADSVRAPNFFPDFLCRDQHGHIVGIEWVILRRGAAREKLDSIRSRMEKALSEGVFEEFLLIYVVPPDLPIEAARKLVESSEALPPSASSRWMTFNRDGEIVSDSSAS